MIVYIYHMNLRDLQYLAAVAKHLHFGRAAESCHVSQPTLSMQLKKLEETLGVQLFERSNKQVMLTPVGAGIVDRARRILEEVEAMHELAQLHIDPLAGEVKLGLFPTLAPYLLPGLMPSMAQCLPKLSVLLVEDKTPELIHKLEAGEIDAALLAMPVPSDALVHTRLFDEPFMLAVSSSHPLARRKSIVLEELKGETMLLLEDGHCMREQALSVCQAIGAGEAKHFRATSLETLRHMVAAGGRVTLMPKLAVEESEAVRYIPFKDPAPHRTIGLYWRKTSAREPLFSALAGMIATDYAKI